MAAVFAMQSNEAPGPDGIPDEVLEVVAGSHPHLILCMFNSCIVAAVVTSCWKMAILVLISKGKVVLTPHQHTGHSVCLTQSGSRMKGC